MGSGSYSSLAYKAEATTRGYDTKSTSDLFCNTVLNAASSVSSLNTSARTFNTSVRPEMLEVGVRECRDSDEHPNTTPIIIAFDVTGSMRRSPEKMCKEQFPKLMDKLTQLGVPDPCLEFMAIGDTECDEFPIQLGQFEADTKKLLDSIQSFALEGGGGGNRYETYMAAWVCAGFHTETDSWYKRGKKGFLFTMGDEPNAPRMTGKELSRFMGYQGDPKPITAEEALEKAKEQYNVFHIHITDASWGFERVKDGWEKLLGDHLLKASSDEVATVIAETIKDNLNLTPDTTTPVKRDDVGSETKEQIIL